MLGAKEKHTLKRFQLFFLFGLRHINFHFFKQMEERVCKKSRTSHQFPKRQKQTDGTKGSRAHLQVTRERASI